MAMMNKLRSQMSERFLAALNQGKLPWTACWQQSYPCNAITERPYRGVNALFLSYLAEEKGYTDQRWCTYHQAQEHGWQVRKGEKSALVEYWAYYDVKEKVLLSWADAERIYRHNREYADKYLQLRSRCYNVFNAEQIDGIPESAHTRTDIGKLRRRRDTLLKNMGVMYQEVAGSGAFYQLTTDTITLPPEATFQDTYGYMATFLHEAAHATGHECRLNRDLSGRFGSPEYAREELRAEIASAFTAQALGLQLTDEQLEYQLRQHTAYVQAWAAALQQAPEELFQAIRSAEMISDYLLEQGEFLLEEESFYAKILYQSFDGDALPCYYDSRDAYTQEMLYQRSNGTQNVGVEMSREQFLEDVAKSLLTQGHYMNFGCELVNDYSAQIREYMLDHPPKVEVHPWMEAENHMVETVYRWEQKHLTDQPDEWLVRADGHTGQLLLQHSSRQALEQRYQMCCDEERSAPTPESTPEVSKTDALEWDWEP